MSLKGGEEKKRRGREGRGGGRKKRKRKMRKLIWNQRRLEVYRSRLDSGNGAKVAVGRQRHPQGPEAQSIPALGATGRQDVVCCSAFLPFVLFLGAHAR